MVDMRVAAVLIVGLTIGLATGVLIVGQCSTKVEATSLLQLKGALDGRLTRSPQSAAVNGGVVVAEKFETTRSPQSAAVNGGVVVAEKFETDSPMEPQMYPKEKALFHKELKAATSYFEYGAGGSTVWAVQEPKLKRILTVESDVEWAAMLMRRTDVKSARSAGRHFFSLIDIGPVRPPSWPLRESKDMLPEFKKYSDQILKSEEQWDLILVDGRFRSACFLKALQHIKNPEKTKLVIHDYERQGYHIVEKFADIVERVERLAVLRKKSRVDEQALAKAVAFYEPRIE